MKTKIIKKDGREFKLVIPDDDPECAEKIDLEMEQIRKLQSGRELKEKNKNSRGNK